MLFVVGAAVDNWPTQICDEDAAMELAPIEMQFGLRMMSPFGEPSALEIAAVIAVPKL